MVGDILVGMGRDEEDLNRPKVYRQSRSPYEEHLFLPSGYGEAAAHHRSNNRRSAGWDAVNANDED